MLERAKLDPNEQHFRIPSHYEGLSLFLRRLGPTAKTSSGTQSHRVVLYVNGATFPSALSIAHRFDGRSWRDELVDAGFRVWGLDFLGFGFSDRYPEMSRPAVAGAAVGRAEDASQQIESATQFIAEREQVKRVSIIAHSWGSMAAGRFAGRRPDLVERLVFFAPITWRRKTAEAAALPNWRLVSLKDQWDRFVADVPKTSPPVLSKEHFDEWGELYLNTDPESRSRTPASVKIPNGPSQDIAAAWAGELAYDPGSIQAPVAIIRGEWDSLVTDADAGWLFNALRHSRIKRDVKISRATHLMHLEQSRYALYRETESFLAARDSAVAIPERHTATA